MTTTGDPLFSQGPPGQPPVSAPSPITVNLPAAPAAAPTAAVTLSLEEVERRIQEAKEAARREEKDKLYPELQETQRRLQELEAAREAERAALEEAQRLEAEAAQRQAQEELSAQQRFEEYRSEQERRWEELQRERELERAAFEREREIIALQAYRDRRLSEEQDSIVPQLADLVSGNTPEEIEASIAQMKERTAAIQADIAEAQGLQAPQRPTPPPVSGMPTMDAADLTGQRQTTLTPEDIRNMSPEEFSRHRAQLLNAVSQRVREGGLYAP